MLEFFKFMGIAGIVLSGLSLLGQIITLPTEVVSSIAFFISSAYAWNFLVNVDLMVFYISTAIVIETALLGWYAVRYLLSYIR